MNDKSLLLAAIIANPEDDAPRLIYADWCEENGDPDRGEFIRLQIEAEKLEWGSPARMDLEGRAEALQRLHAQEWCQEAPSWALHPWQRSLDEYRRGFLSLVKPDCDKFLSFSDDLMKSTPCPTTVIRGIKDGGKELMKHELLKQLRSLSLWFNTTPPNFDVICRSTNLSKIESLKIGFDIRSNRGIVDGKVAKMIASSSHLQHLRQLSFGHDDLQCEGLKAIVNSTNMSSLEEFGFNCRIGDEGAVTVSSSPFINRVKYLNLYGTGVGDNGFEALMAAKPPRLEWLSLGTLGTSITEKSICPTLIGDACPSIVGLFISGNDHTAITPAMAKAYGTSNLWARLRSFTLRDSMSGDDFFTELAHCPASQNLRTMSFWNNGISHIGATALSDSPMLSFVTEFCLGNNPIGDLGAEQFARSQNLSELRVLNLSACQLTGRGVRALATSPGLANLRSLWLLNNPIGEEGARALCDSPYLTKLSCLQVADCGLSEGMKAALKSRFGTVVDTEFYGPDW